MGCSAVYRLDCHVLIVMEKPVQQIVGQRERKDVERQWRLVAVRRQVGAGWPLWGRGWHWQTHFGDVNMGFVDGHVAEVHCCPESQGREVVEEFVSASWEAYQALVVVMCLGCLLLVS